MKEIINIYKTNKTTIEEYISTVLLGLPKNTVESADSVLKKYSFMQLMYEVDKEYKQISPVVCRRDRDTIGINSDKSNYFTRLKLNEKGLFFSNPYIHYRTGKASISVVIDSGDKYTIIDINLILLLEHLRMIEYNSVHEKFKRLIYLVGSTFLTVVSIMLIVFGGYKFTIIILGIGEIDFLQDIFKSIISITLGLAIFDLAKQIFEHEVLFQSFHHPEEKQYKVLGKFLISIVIALAIETLMVVFKIALDDYTHMLSAFYLMIGTTLMFVGLGYFYKTITK
ncbi:MAG: hypothetical protein U9R27_10095 [Campylobacterota bacterium]|nr:hypothetical protein [Campylobacterota bacterium]